jgi:tellurite resistance protein
MNTELDSGCIRNLPIPLFGSVMGLSGLSIAVLRLEPSDWTQRLGLGLLVFTALWFGLLSLGYAIKFIRFREGVLTEFHHPVRMHFFPAISISLLLLAIGFLGIAQNLSATLWWGGAALHFVLLLRTLRVWFFKGLPLQTFNPAWFIPVVGTLLVPIAGVHHAPIEFSWFFFSIGLIFWIAMLGMTLNRVIFHGGLPEKMLPTLFILIAPPAVAFIAYMGLTGELNAFAKILYFHALFMTVLILTFADRFARLPFYLSWWAYTFPLAAITLASIRYHAAGGPLFFYNLGIALLLLLCLVVAIVAIRTSIAARNKTLCVAEI